MQRELKIVLITCLTYFIFGLTSFFNSGSFVTPIFFIKIILIIFCLIFLILNFNKVNHLLLFWQLAAYIGYALTDEFVIGLLTIKWKLFSPEIFELTSFNLLTFLNFWAFILFSILYYHYSFKKWVSTGLLLILFTLSSFLLFSVEYLLQEIVTKCLILAFSILVLKENCENLVTLRLIAYQYIALILLESFEYFV